MSSNGRSRGHQRERDLVNLLRSEGWWAIRSPASKGEVDVVAIRWFPDQLDGHTRVRFIEVKSTTAGPFHSFGPNARAALVAEAEKAGAHAELCWWPLRQKPRFIPAAEWP